MIVQAVAVAVAVLLKTSVALVQNVYIVGHQEHNALIQPRRNVMHGGMVIHGVAPAGVVPLLREIMLMAAGALGIMYRQPVSVHVIKMRILLVIYLKQDHVRIHLVLALAKIAPGSILGTPRVRA